jgi:L-lactate dehydrogenase complex protein LldG
MSAKETILKNIVANKPPAVALPAIDLNEVINYDDPLAQFKLVLESIGGKMIEKATDEDVLWEVNKEKAAGKKVIDVLHEENFSLKNADAVQLALTDLAVIKGEVAVAENGSIWVDEKQMGNRLLPFICQHLIIVVSAGDIVATMHHAYQKIDTNDSGFGVFIAGPSKTADIEQSLVIGAHGARSLVVYIV